MRGQYRADFESVEIYLRNFDSFLIGINRFDPEKANSDNAEKALMELLEKWDRVLASEEFKIFIPFRNILSKFALLTLSFKDVKKLNEEIEKRDKEILDHKKEIEGLQ
mmetsp:Transcript_45592/g.33336  ORF Transcript_45592/g.33336 Transcript_45592/m.33336 type:complete len:108 (+) Transcript_45592:235-558(+)